MVKKILSNFHIKIDHCSSIVPPFKLDNATDVTSPNGPVPVPFVFLFSKVQPTQLNGGTIKIVDSRTFKIAATEVTVEHGALR